MKNKVEVLTGEGTEILNPLVWEFKRPFTFEGKEYNSVDLNKLDDWSCEDLIRVSKKFQALTGGDNSPMGAILPESNIEYDMFVAAEASGLPIDFFKQLPAKEIGTLRTLIISFFLN
jgi:hypothetical protein